MRNFKKIRIYIASEGQAGFFDIYDCRITNLPDDTRRADGRYRLQKMLEKMGVTANNDGTNLMTIFFEKGKLRYTENDTRYPQILTHCEINGISIDSCDF